MELPSESSTKHIDTLFSAIRAGKEPLVRKLVGTDNLESRNTTGQTLLHAAAQTGHVEVVRFLLETGANREAVDANLNTPLHLTVQQKHSAATSVLVEKRRAFLLQAFEKCQSLLMENKEGKTPFDIALQTGDTNLVKKLLDAGADSEATILKACIAGNPEVISLLKKLDITPDSVQRPSYKRPLHLAAEHGQKTVVETLFRDDDTLDLETEDKERNTPLFYAAYNGKVSVAQLLILKGANTNKVLLKGIKEDNIQALETLERAGVDLIAVKDKNGDNILHTAINYGSYKTVEYLLEKIKAGNSAFINRTNNQGETPLHLAAQSGNPQIVLLLLKHKAHDNVYTKNMDSPLHYAARAGHEVVAEILLKNHSSITFNSQFKSPIDLAKEHNHASTVAVISSQKNLALSHQNMLALACEQASPNLVAGLLNMGISCDKPDDNGETPIFKAVRSGCESIVSLLLEKNQNLINSICAGKNLLQLAVENEYHRIALLLLEKGIHKCLDDKNKAAVYQALFAIAENLFEKTLTDPASIRPEQRVSFNALIQILITYAPQLAMIDEQKNLLDALLALCAGFCDESIIQLLFDNGASIRLESPSPLLLAAGSNTNPRVISLLLNHQRSMEIQSKETPRSSPQLSTTQNFLSLWLHNRCPKSIIPRLTNEFIPLLLAAFSGNNEALRIILESYPLGSLKNLLSCDLSELTLQLVIAKQIPLVANNSCTLLHVISAGGLDQFDKFTKLFNQLITTSPENVDQLQFNKTSPRQTKMLPNRNYAAVMKLLVDHQADKESKYTDLELTPLHIATIMRQEPMVKLLVEHGANKSAPDKAGNTPLLWAAYMGHETLVRYFLEQGASVLERSKMLESALHYAILARNENIIKLLHQYNADVNAKNSMGITPLHYAANINYDEGVVLLLDANADTKITDKKGRTPAMIAKKKGNIIQARLLGETITSQELVNSYIKGHTDSISALSVDDEHKISISGSIDKTVKIWNLLDGSCLKTIECPYPVLSLCHDTPIAKIFIGFPRGKIGVIDITTGKLIKIFESPNGFNDNDDDVIKIIYSGHLNYLILHSSTGKVIILDAISGKEVYTLEQSANISIRNVCLGADGERLIAGTAGGAIYIWDIKTNFLRTSLTADGMLSHTMYDPIKNRIISKAKTIQIFDHTSGKLIGKINNFTASEFICSSVDAERGKVVFATKNELFVLDLQTNIVSNIKTNIENIICIAPLLTRNLVLVGTGDGSIHFISTQNFSKDGCCIS